MSFIQDLADYVASNTSLVVDTDLFIAEEPASSPDECVILITSPGSTKSESGLDMQAVQVLSKGKSFIAAESLAQTVFDLLANKPGFSGLTDIFYCEVLNSPFPVEVDGRGRYIFSSNFIIKKK